MEVRSRTKVPSPTAAGWQRRRVTFETRAPDAFRQADCTCSRTKTLSLPPSVSLLF